MKSRGLAIASLAMIASGCATTYRVTPIESPPATVRYDRGAPTTSLEQRNGGVQVTPMSFDADGRMVFGVAAYNNTDAPANFGVENIETQSADNKRLRVFTVDDLVRDARNKAIAASVALALLGVAGAVASQAAAHQTYQSTFYTPRGTYRYKASYYDGAQAVAGTAASIGGATAGIYAVRRTLDATIAGIGESVLQTTTVDPGESVGGRVLVQRSRSSYPQTVMMLVRWNGEEYPFRFQVTKSNGTDPPPPRPEAASEDIAAARAQAEPEPAAPSLAAADAETSPPMTRPVTATAVQPPTARLAPSPPTAQRAASPLAVVESANVTEEDDEAYNDRIRREQASFGR